ncbi:hypothetical protein ILUMI_20149, partial [Ignelater luminosus]
MCYGLDTLETRRLAYEMAKYHNLKIPKAWEERQMAGIDCFTASENDISKKTSYPNFGEGTRVFSLDETGTSTVQKPKNVFASKSSRLLNRVTSAKRGTVVATCCIVSAAGSAFPPAMNFYNAAVDSWMVRHPGQTQTIYNVAELVGQAFNTSMTPSNIKSGFKKTGILSFDRDIFTVDEFLTSEVTNRSLNEEAQLQSRNHRTLPIDNQQPSNSRAALQEGENQDHGAIFSSELSETVVNTSLSGEHYQHSRAFMVY